MKTLNLRESGVRKTITTESATITAMEISDDQLARINKLTLVPYAATQLFVFSVLIIDDSITRNFTQYPESFQRTILSKPPGKGNWIGLTMLMGQTEDHETKAANQKARIFDAYLCRTPEGNVGTIAEAYIPINKSTSAFIENIKAGIHKEVSIGVAVSEPTCSICGDDVRDCPHVPGESFDGNGQPAYIIMQGDAEAQEVSFVAVPGNYNAQVLSDVAGYIPMSEAFGRTVIKKEGTGMKTKKVKGKESNAQKSAKAAADLNKELQSLQKQMKAMEKKLGREARSIYGPDFDGDSIVDDADFDDDGDGVPDSIDSDGGRNPNGRDNDWQDPFDFKENEDDEDKQEEDADDDDDEDGVSNDDDTDDDGDGTPDDVDPDADDEDEDDKYTESIRTLSRSMKKMNERMSLLTEQAKAGRMYQASLLKETLRLGVLAKVIPVQKKETFRKTFARLSVSELKDFQEGYKAEVERLYPATGKSVSLTENYEEKTQIKPVTTSLNDIVAEFKR